MPSETGRCEARDPGKSFEMQSATPGARQWVAATREAGATIFIRADLRGILFNEFLDGRLAGHLQVRPAVPVREWHGSATRRLG